MANLKEIRTRIASVNSTKKITSAMKMVSAAKLKKAQNSLFKFRPFYENIEGLTNHFLDSGKIKSASCIGFRKDIRNIYIVLISSNNSMCGAFNANIVKKAVDVYNKNKRGYSKATISFICIGKRGEEGILRNGLPIVKSSHILIDKPSVTEAKVLVNSFIDDYKSGKVDKVELVFNKFKNTATQEQTVETLLPVVKPLLSKKSNIEPIIEPDPYHFINRLLPYYILNRFYASILESSTSEHGARMTAMHQATENASSLYSDLVIDYNKARQAAITNEITEIVSGADALKQ
ncbi:MAG: ATP synthase F1 subunit gamma [Bacteroidales bacterium]|nr:ATP synthase F1 subunit gamma [Bacteroidales bacterium]HPD94700.1 ATP synthase F1 subunit gamma [Tenuifilaceae bacterium]HRX31242.1 ATP synthase F1 subunit gamma [Tenuifilaceae bacterium]